MLPLDNSRPGVSYEFKIVILALLLLLGSRVLPDHLFDLSKFFGGELI